jgi:hypothetical protein
MSCQPGAFPPKPFIGKVETRPWRTNIGLRLTREMGTWLERHCEAENRTFANYVETLIVRDRKRLKE